jgi:hypothetical protein
MEGLVLTGNNLLLKNNITNVTAGKYQLASAMPSYITDVKLAKTEEGDSLSINAPRIDFSANINAILDNDIHIREMQVQQPEIKRTRWVKASVKKTGPQKSPVRIDRIEINEPELTINIHRDNALSTFSLPHSEKGIMSITDFVMNDSVQIGSLSLNNPRALFTQPGWENIGVEEGSVDLQLSNLKLSRKEGKPVWSAMVNELSLQNPNAFLLGKNKNNLLFNQVAVGNLQLSSSYLSDFSQLLKYNVSAWLRTATGQYTDSNTTLKWYNADYSYANQTLSLDSFTYHPTQPRDSVIANAAFQKDYITFRSGPVQLAGFDLQKYSKDSALIAESITVTEPVVTVYRDKLPPFRAGTIKPLPVDVIKNISLPVSVGRINIENGQLFYTEKNAKSRAEGTLLMTNISGNLSNIKNRNLEEDDSLSLSLNAFLMDSALINLRVKESYADSLSGFLMSLRMRPTTLSFLNPVLAPLTNVVIRSGTIDSLQLRAIGNENLSLGEMNMFYRNLRIRLVKDGNKDSSSFLRNVASFLANTFVIRKNNNGRTGIVYFERLRDRSFFNYIVKMTFSGMATSIGVKSNKKYLKQYKSKLKEQNLPPIDFQ